MNSLQSFNNNFLVLTSLETKFFQIEVFQFCFDEISQRTHGCPNSIQHIIKSFLINQIEVIFTWWQEKKIL